MEPNNFSMNDTMPSMRTPEKKSRISQAALLAIALGILFIAGVTGFLFLTTQGRQLLGIEYIPSNSVYMLYGGDKSAGTSTTSSEDNAENTDTYIDGNINVLDPEKDYPDPDAELEFGL